ncbi:protease [Salmonella enterica subsp. enterica serovar Daytona]|uniref:Protease n=1 Tax=Salmonella enterica subsp. enterica serovar Daytona TaxID=1962639 RepID=A0A447JK20_SALET|nr:protease [Salmonella enterica subsp. enterica serovar Daytona]
MTDALPLLLNLVWDGEGQTTLMQTIQERIAQATQQGRPSSFPVAITLAERFYSELIGLVQRTRVSYPACFNKIRFT